MMFKSKIVPMPDRFHLVLLIHAHQPCGNFGHVLEKAYKDSYLPFIELLEKHPGVHMGLHYSGPLLTWIEENRPEYFVRLKALVSAGQVELIGGGFYEPILVSIPPEDQREQITRLASYLEDHFGHRPTGAWIAERVWEPQLPSALAAAAVNYTLVDDIHFLAAGFEPEELFGTYIAEDRGQSVWLFPGQQSLRYLIPFRKVDEVITLLRDSAALHPGGMAAMGDDLEKFGVWPGTNVHCYKDGWLEKFFTALDENVSWLRVSTPGEYLVDHSPLGRADLPTASYSEMMEWVLPTRVRQRYHAVQKEFSARPEVLSFLRGGSWRGFFRKYSESNLLHKKMLRVSARVAAVPPRHSKRRLPTSLRKPVTCSFARSAMTPTGTASSAAFMLPISAPTSGAILIRAEAIADGRCRRASPPRVELLDFDADGAHEHLFTASEYQALLKPTDGGRSPRSIFGPRPRPSSIPSSAGQRLTTRVFAKPAILTAGQRLFDSRTDSRQGAWPRTFSPLRPSAPPRVPRFALRFR